MKSLLALLAGSVLVVGLSIPTRQPYAGAQEPIYLPNGTALELISFGYRNAVSDYLWMQTISYFGEHFRTDKQYRWFDHQCRLVTRLNPGSFEPFYLCASLLAFEANDPKAAIRLLDDAVKAHPDTWLFFYFRGFYRLYFEHDHDGAKQDFIDAAKRPDAHPIAARLASKSMSELDSPDSAIQFLSGAIKSTSDESARRALQNRLDEIVFERDLDAIDLAIANSPQASTVLELVQSGAYRGALNDPFGGSYIIANGRAASSSGHKRLSDYKGVNRKP